MIIIQERDYILLKYIAKYGVVDKEIVKSIFNNSTQYYRRRKKQLADEKYIVKNNLYVWLGSKGKEYLENKGITDIKLIDCGRLAKKRLSSISKTLIPLERSYNIYPSWILKDGKNILGDRMLKFYGKIIGKYTGKEYYVYNLGSLEGKNLEKSANLKRNYIRIVKNELVQNALLEKISRVIVFADNGSVLKLYKETLQSLGVKEQIMLPLNSVGFTLLNQMEERDMNKEAVECIYGKEYSKPTWVYADYTVAEGKQALILINNDAEKIFHIKTLNNMNGGKHLNIVVICLKSQLTSLKTEFNQRVEFKILPNSFIYKISKMVYN